MIPVCLFHLRAFHNPSENFPSIFYYKKFGILGKELKGSEGNARGRCRDRFFYCFKEKDQEEGQNKEGDSSTTLPVRGEFRILSPGEPIRGHKIARWRPVRNGAFLG